MYDLNSGKEMTDSLNHFDYVRQLEVITEELPYGIKQYKGQVAELVAMDKKLSSLQEKADRNASGKLADKIDALGLEYVAAYKKCVSALDVINKEIEKANVLFVKLSDYYASVGNRRSAKRVRASLDKFEKDNARSLEPAVEAMNSISGIEYIKAMDREPKRQEPKPTVQTSRVTEEPKPESRPAPEQSVPASEPPRRESAPPPPPRHANPYYDPYRTPYYQPMPSFNIAPISIDVNRAVESAVDSFVALFEERVGKYLETKLASLKLDPSDDVSAESEVAKTPSEETLEAPSDAEVAVAARIAEDEAVALDKLASILEGMKGLMAGIGELGEAYSVLEEKQRAAIESAKALSDMQRTLARELQGIQATQKVISTDQLATGEEQAVIFEQQKTALAAQSELSELQSKLTADQLEIMKKQESVDERIGELVASLSSVSEREEDMERGSARLLDMQKNLSERQSELTELQREALLQQKRILRSQRALNEKLGAKRRPKDADVAPEVESSSPENEMTETV